MKLFDLTMSRTVAASAEVVFDVWLDPNSPGGPWFDCERVIINPVVDGLFYHLVEHEGRRWPHYGRFLRIDRPRLIEHTWISESTRGLETIVTVELEPRDGKTELQLRHAGLPDDEFGRRHEAGWSSILSALGTPSALHGATTQRPT